MLARALVPLPSKLPLYRDHFACLSFCVHLTLSGRPVALQDLVYSSHVKWLGNEGPVL